MAVDLPWYGGTHDGSMYRATRIQDKKSPAAAMEMMKAKKPMMLLVCGENCNNLNTEEPEDTIEARNVLADKDVIA